MTDETVFIVKINVQQRSGYFYAASPDLPGLHVCGESDDALRKSVVLAIKTLFKRNSRIDVDVKPVAASLEMFPRDGSSFDRLAVLPC